MGLGISQIFFFFFFFFVVENLHLKLLNVMSVEVFGDVSAINCGLKS